MNGEPMEFDTAYCKRIGCQPTQIDCPQAKRFGSTTHHLSPKAGPKGSKVLRCIYCNRSEKDIREKHEVHS